jgi:hypothetical protein
MTREGVGGGFCDYPGVCAVFFDLCRETVIRDEKDGRAKEFHALPIP